MATVIETLSQLSSEITFQRNREKPYVLNPAQDTPPGLLPNDEERGRLRFISGLLEHKDIQDTIDTGQITFAMIRPRLDLGRSNLSEEELMGEIKDRARKASLNIILELPIQFDPTNIEEFYAEVKPNLEALPAPAGGLGDTIWQSFNAVLIGGPATVLLLYLESENNHETAIAVWRRLIGPTIADPEEDAGTIRGDFGNAVNNIVHGSDSINSVRKEVRWLAEKIKTL